jgi:HepT-like protein
MTEREREARHLRLFLARLGQDREAAEAVHGRLAIAVRSARTSGPDVVNVAAVALFLQNLYTAVEGLFRRVAVDLDGSEPGGDNWHRELLGQMALEIGDVRPRLIGGEFRADLDQLRRFRHLVRHAYATEYDWEEMEAVIEAADRAVQALPAALVPLQETIRAAIRECEGDAKA